MERAFNPSNSSRASCYDRRHGNPFLPASFRNRRRGSLLTANLQNRRTQNRSPTASSDCSSRSGENIVHICRHFLTRPNRKTTIAFNQRRRNGTISSGISNFSNDYRPHGEESDVGCGNKYRYGDDLCSYVFDRRWTYNLGLYLGDIPVEVEITGFEYGCSCEQSDEWCDRDGVSSYVERDDHGRSVLLVRRDCDGGLGFLLHFLAGDAREDA